MADFLLNKINESWDTPAKLDEKMNDLKRKMKELNALKEDTESRKSTELLHPRKKLKKEVELWFKNVERINGEVQDLQQKVGESSVVSRGLFKGNVSKKIQEVEELFQQGKSHKSLVVDNPRWIGQALSTTTLFGGAAKICMEEIWTNLMGANVQKIGVWGMGGIGKTTIMKLIHNQLLKETEKFNIVIWITVSKEMNIFKMQKWIAQAIDKTMDETLDKVEDETTRAGMIQEMLDRKGKYVVILDDLWDKLSLEEVGIPEPSKGSKLLVTTRLLDVCRSLGCQEVRVPTLSKSDAWSLFLEKVGLDVSNHLDLLPTMKSVAEECAGLPLAIVTIASSMKGVHDIHEWRNALEVLRRHEKSVNKMEKKVFQQLKFSYRRLEDTKVKHCFLCCALYPEDYEINTNKLIKLWIAEGLVKEKDSMQTEIDEGQTILNKLKNSCLIEKVTAVHGGDGVKLHDVVRDMALRIRRRRFLVRAGMQLKEIPDVTDWNEDLQKVSLMNNRYLQIPSQMPPPKCQKLTTLLLSGCSIESIPECFFEQMHGLKILDLSSNPIKSLPNSISNLETLTELLLSHCSIESIPESFFEQMRGLKILNLSANPIKSLPNSICNLETLTTFLLCQCKELEKLPSFSKLQALKRLKLYGTKIKSAPHGMERLVNLIYLDLRGTRIEEIADGILAKLTSLQHLALDLESELFTKGEEIGGLKKLELFEGRFFDLKEFKSYGEALLAQKRGPCQYCICVGEVSTEDVLFEKEINTIKLYVCDIICTDNDIKVPSDVEKLDVIGCDVDLCGEGTFMSRFIPVPFDIFSFLNKIEIFSCQNIKKLFSSNWVLHNLQNLCSLCVRHCEDMEEIIASEPELEEEGTSAFKFTLPKLCWLKLTDLPELKSICGANGVMVCDSIKWIYIENCPKLKRISLNLPLQDDGQPYPPPSLGRIWVSSKEWWESVEWDHPNAKSLLQPYVRELW